MGKDKHKPTEKAPAVTSQPSSAGTDAPAKKAKGHRQRGAGTVVTAKPAVVTGDGVVLKPHECLPCALLHEYCQREKRPTPCYIPKPPGRRMEVVLHDSKNSKNDLRFATEQSFNTDSIARDYAALLALFQLQRQMPLERRLPEPYATTWTQMVRNHSTTGSVGNHTGPGRAGGGGHKNSAGTSVGNAAGSIDSTGVGAHSGGEGSKLAAATAATSASGTPKTTAISTKSKISASKSGSSPGTSTGNSASTAAVVPSAQQGAAGGSAHWLCNGCGSQNFATLLSGAMRTKCFKCQAAKSEHCTYVATSPSAQTSGGGSGGSKGGGGGGATGGAGGAGGGDRSGRAREKTVPAPVLDLRPQRQFASRAEADRVHQEACMATKRKQLYFDALRRAPTPVYLSSRMRRLLYRVLGLQQPASAAHVSGAGAKAGDINAMLDGCLLSAGGGLFPEETCLLPSDSQRRMLQVAHAQLVQRGFQAADAAGALEHVLMRGAGELLEEVLDATVTEDMLELRTSTSSAAAATAHNDYDDDDDDGDESDDEGGGREGSRRQTSYMLKPEYQQQLADALGKRIVDACVEHMCLTLDEARLPPSYNPQNFNRPRLTVLSNAPPATPVSPAVSAASGAPLVDAAASARVESAERGKIVSLAAHERTGASSASSSSSSSVALTKQLLQSSNLSELALALHSVLEMYSWDMRSSLACVQLVEELLANCSNEHQSHLPAVASFLAASSVRIGDGDAESDVEGGVEWGGCSVSLLQLLCCTIMHTCSALSNPAFMLKYTRKLTLRSALSPIQNVLDVITSTNRSAVITTVEVATVDASTSASGCADVSGSSSDSGAFNVLNEECEALEAIFDETMHSWVITLRRNDDNDDEYNAREEDILDDSPSWPFCRIVSIQICGNILADIDPTLRNCCGNDDQEIAVIMDVVVTRATRYPSQTPCVLLRLNATRTEAQAAILRTGERVAGAEAGTMEGFQSALAALRPGLAALQIEVWRKAAECAGEMMIFQLYSHAQDCLPACFRSTTTSNTNSQGVGSAGANDHATTAMGLTGELSVAAVMENVRTAFSEDVDEALLDTAAADIAALTGLNELCPQTEGADGSAAGIDLESVAVNIDAMNEQEGKEVAREDSCNSSVATDAETSFSSSSNSCAQVSSMHPAGQTVDIRKGDGSRRNNRPHLSTYTSFWTSKPSSSLSSTAVAATGGGGAGGRFQKATLRPLPHIVAARQKLPAWKMRTKFLSLLEQHRGLVVTGETGCGKTTQIPQFIYEANPQTKVVVCQPRRLAAVGVAGRVAEEMGCTVGEEVGYMVKGDSRCSATTTRITFVTYGVLLRVLQEDPLLDAVGVVILDEVHERGMDSDLTLALLVAALSKRKDLKIILMSATIATDRFASYLGRWIAAAAESTAKQSGSIALSQAVEPVPVLFIPGFTYPVAEYYKEDFEDIVRSFKDFHHTSPITSSSSCYDRDDQDSEGGEGEEERGLTRLGGMQRKGDLDYDLLVKLIMLLTNGNYSSFPQQNSHGKLDDAGMAAASSGVDMFTCAQGCILVFVPGVPEINRVISLLQTHWKPSLPLDRLPPPSSGSGTSRTATSSASTMAMRLLPLHGGLSPTEQRKVFQPAKANEVKVVVATNVAEASITIEVGSLLFPLLVFYLL